MQPIEQVFLRVRTRGRRRKAGVLAATSEVRSVDLAEMVDWFTDDCYESVIRFDSLNLFFHPLPSGHYAVGLLSPVTGNTYSFFQKPRSFYVQVLVVSPETYYHYDNHPMFLIGELQRHKQLVFPLEPPECLSPIEPACTAPLRSEEPLKSFDMRLAQRLAESVQPIEIARLTQSLFDSVSTLLIAPFSAGKLSTWSFIAATLSLFPVRFRTELTFATDTFISLRQPLRIIGVCSDKYDIDDQVHQLGLPVFGFDQKIGQFRRLSGHAVSASTPTPAEKLWQSDPLAPWSRLLLDLFQSRDFSLFASLLHSEKVLSASVANADTEELHNIADAWLKQIQTHIAGTPAYFVGTPVSDDAGILSEKLTLLDSTLSNVLSGDHQSIPVLRQTWATLGRRLSWERRDLLRETYLSLVRSYLVSATRSGGTSGVHHRVSLFEAMLVFLE